MGSSNPPIGFLRDFRARHWADRKCQVEDLKQGKVGRRESDVARCRIAEDVQRAPIDARKTREPEKLVPVREEKPNRFGNLIQRIGALVNFIERQLGVFMNPAIRRRFTAADNFRPVLKQVTPSSQEGIGRKIFAPKHQGKSTLEDHFGQNLSAGDFDLNRRHVRIICADFTWRQRTTTTVKTSRLLLVKRSDLGIDPDGLQALAALSRGLASHLGP